MKNLSSVGQMYQTMKQYGLSEMVHQVLEKGRVGSYVNWKKRIVEKVMFIEAKRQFIALKLYPSLYVYNLCIKTIDLCAIWKLAVSNPKLKEKCRSVVSFMCAYNARYRMVNCEFCDCNELDTVQHLVLQCPMFRVWRDTFETDTQVKCELTDTLEGDAWLEHKFSGGCNESECETIVVRIHALIVDVRQRKLIPQRQYQVLSSHGLQNQRSL